MKPSSTARAIAERNRRIRLEEVIIRALDESQAEGYGDCPHGGEGACTWCDAHWAADALIKGATGSSEASRDRK